MSYGHIYTQKLTTKKLNGYQEYYGSVHTFFLYISREKPCHSNNRRLVTELLYSKDPIEWCCTLRQDAMIMNNKVKEFFLLQLDHEFDINFLGVNLQKLKDQETKD